VATPYAGEAIATPRLTGAHLRKDLLGLGFHPVCETLFVLAKVVSESQNRETKAAAIPVVRIEIDEVAYIRQRVGLDADYAKILPCEQVILIGFSPALNVGWQRLAANLNR
jgi:hypothetical protein